MVSGALFTSDCETWATPDEVFALVNKEFALNFDVCALPVNKKCDRFFSPEQNALSQSWIGRCWMNPPYGRDIGKWMEKACNEVEQGNAAVCVCLVPARTDTQWWHEWATRGEVRFIRKRIRFVGATANAPFPSALIVFRNKWWEKR